ncbi:glycine N-acyltransferase-like protein 3 [Pygocentrus nattereri]|uniref:Glycine N-acyltransferase-like protein n=1 Tax=Pygocentrus nattereri TaxID=42514 RepID=A0A3B4E4E1_PYGNA|nr:glycine N-acyltransferase-like protein 3 [Pygocentrus nattereri]
MKVLTKEELKLAEKTLRHYLPKSQQVYGFVVLINRVEADPVDVLVDHWPDFSVLLVKPMRQEEADLYKGVCIFAKDGVALKNVLLETDILDWTQYLCLSFDLCYEETVKAVAANRGVKGTKMSVCHMIKLDDCSDLPTDGLSVQVSSLQESHTALVNSTWKFGSGKFSERMIRNMILNFPSCCVLDSDGQPVAWILTYCDCAMGILYTMPEHRKKGYAKALVSIMAKKLHSEGYPLYCFIEEHNRLSYSLFASLGFTEDPSYRVTWYSFNEMFLNPQ